jgi:hypothetical protein
VKTIRVNGVRISFVASLPRRFDRGAIADRLEGAVSHTPPSIVQVLARVSARTANAAFNEAQAAVDLIRALWNFVLIHGIHRILQIGPPKPTNRILPGSVHTLHNADGTLIEDIFWVESQPLKADWIYTADERWPTFERRARNLRSALRFMSYRPDIENALVRYVRALDDADPRSSFNRVWSVLEYLTDSVGNYTTLIRRASFLVRNDERVLTRILLEHLRDVRNAVVHADEERTNMTTYLDQLRSITEGLIRFHLHRGNLFKSRARAAKYLDTPTDRTLLLEGLSDYRRALRRS